MMEYVDAVTLEDGLKYIVTDEIEINNNKYVYLTEENNIEKIGIRKVRVQDGKEVLVGLDNENEFRMALTAFGKKNNKE